jgi:drug/metabolite transporter (DMT)-like permease
MFPLMTMIVAAALGRERLTVVKTAGVLLSVVGVGVALGPKALERGAAPHQWVGELAVLGSALSGAVCSVLYRPYLRKYPTLSVSALAMLASIAFLAVLAAGEGFFAAWPRFTPAGWLAVVFIGAGSGVGYFLWLWALKHMTPTRVAVFLALSPVTAAIFGALLLREAISLPVVIGLACVVCGLWLAHARDAGPAALRAERAADRAADQTENARIEREQHEPGADHGSDQPSVQSRERRPDQREERPDQEAAQQAAHEPGHHAATRAAPHDDAGDEPADERAQKR